MIVDTSAVIAVLLDEPEGERFAQAMIGAESVQMSAATYVECAIVVDRRTAPAGRIRFDRLIRILGIQIVPLTASQAEVAREAYRRFGRGSGHRARLNLGDCYSYALAADSGDPLLFKGEDFSATDIQSVGWTSP